MVKQKRQIGLPFLASGRYRWQYVVATMNQTVPLHPRGTPFLVYHFAHAAKFHLSSGVRSLKHENHFPLVWRR